MKINDKKIQNRLVSLLAEKYGLNAREIHFIPVGEESLSYQVIADNGQAYFAKYCQKREIIERLRDVHELLVQIRDLDFVIPPLVASHQTEFDLGNGKVYVFPYIEGEILARPNEIFEKELVDKITGILAQIHKQTDRVKAALPVEHFNEVDREQLQLKRLKVRLQKADGPLKRMFEENEGIIAGVIEAQASEANVYRGRSVDMVLTHGDVTGRNMIQTSQGLKLVDWDGAMLAPAERDINFFYDNPNFSLDRYYGCMGKDKACFDRRLMGYYGRQWVIESILENFEKLLAPVPENDKQEYLDEINQYIGYCSL